MLLVRGPTPWLLDLELQSSRDPDLTRRLLKYHALLHDRHALPVHTLVVLLRREADDPATGSELAYQSPGGRSGMRFLFEVIRLW